MIINMNRWGHSVPACGTGSWRSAAQTPVPGLKFVLGVGLLGLVWGWLSLVAPVNDSPWLMAVLQNCKGKAMVSSNMRMYVMWNAGRAQWASQTMMNLLQREPSD
jgi:hypothetical protein